MGSALVLTLQRGRGVATVVCQITHCMQTLGSINWAAAAAMLATTRPQQLAFFKVVRSLTIVLLMVYSRCYNSSEFRNLTSFLDQLQVISENPFDFEFLVESFRLFCNFPFFTQLLMLLLLLIEIGLKNEVENKSCVKLKTISFLSRAEA